MIIPLHERGKVLTSACFLSFFQLTSGLSFRAVVHNLGPPDVLGLQLPEILASRGGGEGFWEL